MSPISETLCPNETESSQQPHIELRVVVFTLRDGRLHILLQPSDPALFPDHWEFPAFPILPGQALEQTAENCLREIMHVHEVYLEQLYTYGGPQRHPAQALVSVVYFSLIPLDRHPLRSQPSALAWMPVNTPPRLAMDHAGILAYALRRLRYKLEYTAVGFELLPETFSLSELQQTYEMILDEVLDKRNFRRRILQAGIIEPTEEYRSGEGRPARLYRYRPDAVAEVKTRRLFP
jgi:8-oxo-dGTP diphosphatase